jgi:hypothetical protein
MESINDLWTGIINKGYRMLFRFPKCFINVVIANYFRNHIRNVFNTNTYCQQRISRDLRKKATHVKGRHERSIMKTHVGRLRSNPCLWPLVWLSPEQYFLYHTINDFSFEDLFTFFNSKKSMQGLRSEPFEDPPVRNLYTVSEKFTIEGYSLTGLRLNMYIYNKI